MSKSGRRVSARQFEVLWEFLNTHRHIATGLNRSLQAKAHSKKKWEEVTVSLNSEGVDGATKRWQEWSKYWVDYKAKLKRRLAEVRRTQSGTGGGPSTAQPLTEIELKFIHILGEDFGQGLPGVQVNPFPENAATQNPLLPPLQHMEELEQIQESEILESVAPPCMLNPPTFNVITTSSLPPSAPQSTNIYTCSPPQPGPCSPSQPGPSSSPQPDPPRSQSRRSISRRSRRTLPPISQEAARRALIESSRMKAEAAVKMSVAAERVVTALEGIKECLERIERVVNAGFPRAAQQEPAS